MKVDVSYLGQLQQAAGVASERKECAGTTLAELLNDVAEAHGPGFRAILLDDSGAVRPSVMVLVNDAPVSKDALPELSDGDAITLLTAIAGG